MPTYRSCRVPMCGNTTLNHPEKLFIHVPKCPKRRKTWLQLARRDPKTTSSDQNLFFCEDHFDLPNDMANYIRYTTMGYVSQIMMKKDCVPSRFECQPDRVKRTAPLQNRSAVQKRLHKELIKDIMSQKTVISETSTTKDNDTQQAAAIKQEIINKEKESKCQDKTTQAYPATSSKYIQVYIRPKFRSKAVQTNSKIINKNTPLDTNMTCTSNKTLNEDKSGCMHCGIKRKLPSSEESYLNSSPSKYSQTSDTSAVPFLFVTTSYAREQNTQTELNKNDEAENLSLVSRENTVRIIKNNPEYYIGLPKDCYYLIDEIQKEIDLPEVYILLCLKKIRLNTPFIELGDQFGMSLTYATQIFIKSVSLIASALRQFITQAKRTEEQNPVGFKHDYHNIYCMKCLEINIQKPSESVEQDSSSEGKNTYTAKYLISCTSDGINYVSPGYTGDTNVQLIQNCNFLDCIEPAVLIIAEGFEDSEEILQQDGIKLLRPSALSPDMKETSNIERLRMIDSMIRRVRDYSMLKPHSVISTELSKCLDDCIIIVCALINVQNSTDTLC